MTALAVPSSSPEDLLFNAQKIDEAVNTPALTYTDRFGTARRTLAGATASIALVNPRGAWVTATAYAPRDLVSNSGTWYIALDAHTSGATFAGDVAAHWRVHQGVLASDLAASGASATIGFIASGVGAVPRTVQAKVREVVSAFDFGAVADGNLSTGAGTNNAATMQAAINALGALGVLFQPSGVFKVSSQLAFPSDFTWRGAGNYCSIVFAPAAFNDATGLIKLNGAGGPPTVIEDLCITGQVGGAGAASVGINSIANGVFLRNLWVGGFKTNVVLGQTDNFLLDSVVEESIAGGTGVSIISPDVTVANCVIYHCYVGLAVTSVPFLDGTISISNVRTMACTFMGFNLTSSSNIQISNCSHGHNNTTAYTAAGLYMSGCSNVVVTGNIARLGGGPSTTGMGIQVQACSRVVITGSQSSYFVDGINISGSTDVVISGNQCNSNYRSGIYEAGNDKLVITGNSCYANGSGAATDAGIHSENTVGFGLVSITNNTCSQVGGGVQDYGIYASLTDNGGSTGTTLLSGNTCQFNSVSDITLAGKTNRIVMEGNVPVSGAGSSVTVIVTASTYALGLAEKSIVANFAGTVTLTLPPAATAMGRPIRIKTITANAVISNASNVVPAAGGAAGTAILAATAGKWVALESDGSNWQIMASN